MKPERYQQVCEIFLAARSKHPADRDVFLNAACKDDTGLRGEVESLLANDDAATNFLDNPVLGDDFLNQVPPSCGTAERAAVNRASRSRVAGGRCAPPIENATPAEKAPEHSDRQRAILATVSIGLLLALLLVGWQAIRVTRQRDDAVRAREFAEQRRAAAEHAAAEATMDAARAALRMNDVAAARHRLDAVPDALRDAAWHALVAQSDKSLATLAEHDGAVLCAAFSPDGTLLASGAEDGTLRLWDVKTHRLMRTMLVAKAAFAGLAFSPDGDLLAAGTIDGELSVWDAANGEVLASWIAHRQAIRYVAFSPDGMSIASASDDKTARLWDVAANVETARFDHPDGVSCVVFDQAGERLATGCRDDLARIWILGSASPRAFLELGVKSGRGDVTLGASVAFSPDGAMLAAGSAVGMVTLWDSRTGERLHTLSGHAGRVGCVAFSPDATQLASGSSDTTVRVWDTATGAGIETLHGHIGDITSVAYAPCGEAIASSSRDKTIRLWNSQPDARQSAGDDDQ